MAYGGEVFFLFVVLIMVGFFLLGSNSSSDDPNQPQGLFGVFGRGIATFVRFNVWAIELGPKSAFESVHIIMNPRQSVNSLVDDVRHPEDTIVSGADDVGDDTKDAVDDVKDIF
jgi:hypothetical protein